jgi:RHS repeat-associated protein
MRAPFRVFGALIAMSLLCATVAHAKPVAITCPLWKSGIGRSGDPVAAAYAGLHDTFKNAPQCLPVSVKNCVINSPHSTQYTCEGYTSGNCACSQIPCTPHAEGTSETTGIGLVYLGPLGNQTVHCGYHVNDGTPEPPKNNGDPKDKGCQNSCGNPVNTGTGGKYQREVDFARSYEGGLEFVRHYNSGARGSTSSVGANWQHNWDLRIEKLVASEVYANRGDGVRRTFVPDGSGSWVGEADTPDVLAQTASGWTLTTRNNEVETYDSEGRILTSVDSIGRTTTFAYSDGTAVTATIEGTSIPLFEGTLIRVTDFKGRSMSFGYDASGYLVRMTDPTGSNYLYQFDISKGNLVAVIYPDDRTRSYHYNEPAHNGGTSQPFALTGITDENGARFATYQYDSSGRVTRSEHAAGADGHTFTYGTFGVSSYVDPLGTARTTAHEVVLGVAKRSTTTQPCPGCGGPVTSTQAFDGNGNLSSVKDFNGNLTCFGYEFPRNLETSRVEGLSGSGTCAAQVTTSATRKFSTEWHPQWRLPKRIAEPLRLTTYAYHGEAGVQCAPAGAATTLLCSRNVQATTDATGSSGFAATADGAPRTWSYTYNADGQVTSMDGPRTDVADTATSSFYAADDLAGNYRRADLASTTNALGHTTSFTHYDGAGRLKRMVDANGLETLLEYWPRGWLKSRSVGTASAGYETTAYDYDFVGQLARVTAPDGSFVEYGYDDAHRLAWLRDGLGNRIDYTLDGAGNRLSEQAFDPGNNLARAHSREFDALGRLYRDIGGTSPASQVALRGYDANGNPTSTVDPLSRATTQLFDARDRLTEVRDPVNGAASPTLYAYNARDQLTAVTDPKGLSTTYATNGHGELMAQSSPDTGVTGFTYDPASNLKAKLDARGITANYTYDALNRITQIAFPDETVTYTFDSCANGIGRLCALSDGTGTTTWSYDVKGRVIAKVQTAGTLSQTVQYGYNGAGQLVSIATPGGQLVEYGYENGRPVSVRVNGTTVLDQVLYEPFGPNGGWRWGNSTAGNPNFHLRLFDRDFRATVVESDLPAGAGAPRIASEFTWDVASRLTAITDLADAALSASYGYDDLDRLTGATQGASSRGYSYDGVGNRLASNVGAATTSYAYAPGSHRLASLAGAKVRSYTFDAAGNMVSDGIASWSYGGNNRPTQVQVGSTLTTFAINALGQRVRKASGASATRFFYDEAGRLLGEYADSGALIAETIWLEDLPVAVVKAQPAAPPEQTIDNGASGFSSTGTWAASTAVAGFLGTSYLTHAPGADAVGAVIVDNTDAGFSVTGSWGVSTAVPGYLGASYRTHEPNGPPPLAVVVDNTDAGASATGTWPESTGAPGYLGANYATHAAGTGASAFTWSLPVAQAGSYDIYARWTASANRATNATYAVATASGSVTVSVNQQVNGGSWQRLGTFALAAGSATVTLTDQANGYVIADAVMIAPEGAAPSTATWQATLPSAGNWRVYARWPAHPNRASNAVFRVQTPSGTVPVSVNQQANGGSWQLLGTYAFGPGAASVSLDDRADGYVIADAVKFEPEGALPESVTWTPAIASPARYEVYARWTALANRTPAARYVAVHQGGEAVVTQNQQVNGGAWNLLGTWTFAPGQGVRLEASEGGYAIADALRFVPSAEQPASGGLFYVHPDHLGTPRAITRPGDNALVWSWPNTDPFGGNAPEENPSGAGTFAFNLRFPGQYFDQETGTHYNYFRDYDPGIGRYVQSDPIGLRGGINTYSYVDSAPLTVIDPTGLLGRGIGGDGGQRGNEQTCKAPPCTVIWMRCEITPCGKAPVDRSSNTLIRNYRERCQQLSTCWPFYIDVDTGPCPLTSPTAPMWGGFRGRMR